jgi:predicted nucleotidyltransferase
MTAISRSAAGRRSTCPASSDRGRAVESATDMAALDRLPEILGRELAVAFPDRRLLGAWLYGSHAQGQNRADRDVDVGVLFDAPFEPVAERMRRMVGFRNVAVHEYRRLDPAVVSTVVEHRLGDFADLCRELSAVS